MRFQDIPGHRILLERFARLHHTNRLPHTMLIAGRSGYGSLAIALALAQYLTCEHPGDDACGQCKSCRLNAKYTHPDVHFSFPFINNKAQKKETSNDYLTEWREMLHIHPYFSVSEWLIHLGGDNKQGNINAKEISNINGKMSLKSFGGGRKVLLIWMAEYLGREGNKLLKLIEEPPENTSIILVAENTDRMLPTILSRCQFFPISKLHDDELHTFLKNIEGDGDVDLETIVRLGDGNLGIAIGLTQDVNQELSRIFKKWMQCCFIGNGIETMKFIKEHGNMGRESQKAFVQYGLHFFGEYLRYYAIGDVDILRLTSGEKVSVQKLRNKLDFENLQKIVAELERLNIAVDRNGSFKIHLLKATIRIHQYFRSSYSSPASAGIKSI
ncbi:MAG: hypothetical protein KJP00_11050 [Bacteroidia bacterium]|nr:hypothetical protein [Bacteroidia bacterium]